MKLNIKSKVDKLDISKNKLAQQLGISYPTMLDMYNGESTSIKFDTLEKLCNILQCTPNDILIFDSKQENISKSTDSLPTFANHGITASFLKDIQDKYPDYSIVHIKDLSKLLSDNQYQLSWNFFEDTDGTWAARPYIKLPKELINILKDTKSDTE